MWPGILCVECLLVCFRILIVFVKVECSVQKKRSRSGKWDERIPLYIIYTSLGINLQQNQNAQDRTDETDEHRKDKDKAHRPAIKPRKLYEYDIEYVRLVPQHELYRHWVWFS